MLGLEKMRIAGGHGRRPFDGRPVAGAPRNGARHHHAVIERRGDRELVEPIRRSKTLDEEVVPLFPRATSE